LVSLGETLSTITKVSSILIYINKYINDKKTQITNNYIIINKLSLNFIITILIIMIFFIY